MGAYRGLKEALFPALISTDFLQNLPKFCSEDAGISPARIPKTHLHISYTPLLCASQRPKNSTISPKNFRQLSTRLYRTCRQDATLGANICKRVHSNTSLEGSPQHPPGTLKNVPRKATTGQNARRCKYSLLGIQ